MKKLFLLTLLTLAAMAGIQAQVGFYNYKIQATGNDTLTGADTLIYTIIDGTDVRPWMCSPIIAVDSIQGSNWGVVIEFQVANWNTGTANSQKNWITVSTQTVNGGGSSSTFWVVPASFEVWHRGLRLLIRTTTAGEIPTKALVNGNITHKSIRN